MVNLAGAKSSMCDHAKQTWLGNLEVGKDLLPAALSASVSLFPQLEKFNLLEQWRSFQDSCFLFPPPASARPSLYNLCRFEKVLQLAMSSLQ